jgi:O-antigen/teichoic acid export membrane protein
MFLTGSGHLWQIVGAYFIALPIQIVTNFLLIPTYGAVGVAAGTLLSQAAAVVVLVAAARGCGMSFPIGSILRHALAVAAMVLPVMVTRHLIIPIPILCGGLVYVGALLVISPATSLERRLVGQLFAHRRGR